MKITVIISKFILIIETVNDYLLLISDNIPIPFKRTKKRTVTTSVCFFLKGLCLCFYRARDIDSRRCDAKINTRNDFRRRRGLPLHLPFVFPLNYLRALRDWPTNPVRLNNLPIIRGPLCFIRRVSNKSHCVFKRAASNSILCANPLRISGDGKRRSEETEEETRERGDRARFARIDSKFG